MTTINPYGLSFDGSNDYVDLGDIPLNNNLTIEMTIKLNSTKSGQCFFGKNTSKGENMLLFGYWNGGYYIVIRNSNKTFYTPSNINEYKKLTLIIESTDNKKSHVIALENNKVVADFTLNNVINDENGKTQLGMEYDESKKSDFFNGCILDFKLWNRSKSIEEIINNIDNQDSLTAYYKFDEGEGVVLHDSSPNKYHGTIHGATWITINNEIFLQNAINIKATSAVLQAAISTSKKGKYYFEYTTDPDFKNNINKTNPKDLIDKTFFIQEQIKNLEKGQTYYYRTVVEYEDNVLYGEISSFKLYNEEIKINNEVLAYNNIYYIDPNGSDEIGDGSYNNPFANYIKAIDVAQYGDAIVFKEGKHRLKPYTDHVGYSQLGLFLLSGVDVIGENPAKTVLEWYGNDSSERDSCLIGRGIDSKIINLTFIYYPDSNAPNSYSKSIFRWCSASVYNCVFYIKDTSAPYVYYNSDPGDLNIYNSIFYFDESSLTGYSGKLKVHNCLSNQPYRANNGVTNTTSIVKDFDINNISSLQKDEDLLDKGTGLLDPDGSIADIGVFGGPFAWAWQDDSHLVKDGNDILTFDLINQEWIVLDPNKENFKNKGITDLGNLIQNTTKIINVKTKLDSGQVFKESINFKAYKVITNISIA